jgi:hypothetical protein
MAQLLPCRLMAQLLSSCLRARLQPCHNRSSRRAALAAEVRFALLATLFTCCSFVSASFTQQPAAPHTSADNMVAATAPTLPSFRVFELPTDKRKYFTKTEVLLAEALDLKEAGPTQAALALAYLSRGKLAEAENVHPEGIRLKLRSRSSYDTYAAFISDVGHKFEARRMEQKSKILNRIN